MEIYAKIFSRLQEMHMSQTELSKRTGIATSTISDWRKKKINPQSDKLVPICKALDVSLVDLLCNEDDRNNTVLVKTDNASEMIIIEEISNASEDIKNKVFQYFRLLSIRDNFTEQEKVSKDKRNISIIQDVDGKNIDWDEIEKILRQYIGEFYEIYQTAEKVYIGTDFPDEYTHSKYTKAIRGANEKAKANAITAIGELISIADNKIEYPDYEGRHGNKAKNGWYRYDTRFGIPIYDESGEIERYNIFRARLLIRCNEKKQLFLYDIIQIKKETSTPLE